MNTAGAPDDFEKGYLTQTWLAMISRQPSAGIGITAVVLKEGSSTSLAGVCGPLATKLAELTGVSLF